MGKSTRKLKLIIGNGAYASRVVDAETGEEIEGIAACEVTITESYHFTPVVHLTLVNPEIELANKEEHDHGRETK